MPPLLQQTPPSFTNPNDPSLADIVGDNPAIVAIEDMLEEKNKRLSELKASYPKSGDPAQQFATNQIDEIQRDLTALADTKAHILSDISKEKSIDARAALRNAMESAHFDQQHKDAVQKEYDTKAMRVTGQAIQQENADTARQRAKAYSDYLTQHGNTSQQ